MMTGLIMGKPTAMASILRIFVRMLLLMFTANSCAPECAHRRPGELLFDGRRTIAA
jgi:hypothetical protein